MDVGGNFVNNFKNNRAAKGKQLIFKITTIEQQQNQQQQQQNNIRNQNADT